MSGLTMLIGFYNRGPVGAQAALPGIMISSSAYVLHSANILYRNVFDSFDAEAARAGVFLTNVHSQGTNRSEDIPKARIFMDRSWFTTFSMYCTYAGNTLMLKKGNHRFAVDLCTYYRRESELSEHMFITGMTGPGGGRPSSRGRRRRAAARRPRPWWEPTTSATTSRRCGSRRTGPCAP